MVKLIGITGYAGSGKDTVGLIIMHNLFWFVNKNSCSIQKFAAKVKEVASVLTGVDAIKFDDQEFKKAYNPLFGMTNRELLQKIGTEALRDHLHPDVWIKSLFKDYNPSKNIWIITDVRFPNEYQAIKERGGVIIRKYGPDDNIPMVHESESYINTIPADLSIPWLDTELELSYYIKKHTVSKLIML